MVIDEKSNISLLKAMGESTPQKILSILVYGERCACEIPSLIKRSHLIFNASCKITRLGNIQSRRDGKNIVPYKRLKS